MCLNQNFPFLCKKVWYTIDTLMTIPIKFHSYCLRHLKKKKTSCAIIVTLRSKCALYFSNKLTTWTSCRFYQKHRYLQFCSTLIRETFVNFIIFRKWEFVHNPQYRIAIKDGIKRIFNSRFLLVLFAFIFLGALHWIPWPHSRRKNCTFPNGMSRRTLPRGKCLIIIGFSFSEIGNFIFLISIKDWITLIQCKSTKSFFSSEKLNDWDHAKND